MGIILQVLQEEYCVCQCELSIISIISALCALRVCNATQQSVYSCFVGSNCYEWSWIDFLKIKEIKLATLVPPPQKQKSV